MNTCIRYAHRDTNNRLTHFEEIMAGTTSFHDMLTIRRGCINNNFLPQRCGLKAETFASLGHQMCGDIPLWHEIEAITTVDHPVSCSLSVSEFIQYFENGRAINY